MLKTTEVTCKTILNKSGISDFTLNCYVGCSHRCLYCYGRYMEKFRKSKERWDEFVDVKINAPEVLFRQIKKIKPPQEVFMSSICDGWQPLEAKYRLSRQCLKMLLEAGFDVSILTKSSLILRDFDLLAAYKTPSLGVTITTLNRNLQKLLEPYASSPQERINLLKQAQDKGIKTWVFLGPLIPEFTATPANLETIFRALEGINLQEVCVDRLNLRWGVLRNIQKGLQGRCKTLNLRLLLYKTTNPAKYQEYSRQLKESALQYATRFGFANKLTVCF